MNKVKLLLIKYPMLFAPLSRMNSFIQVIFSLPKFVVDIFWSIYYFRTCRIVICNHITFGIRRLGVYKTFIPHPIGIVIGKGVTLGYGCIIYQNVTLGVKYFGCQKYPTLGNNVIVYAGASIIGDVVIGNNCIIGAGCIVNKSIPSNMVAYGNPMKIIHKAQTNSLSEK